METITILSIHLCYSCVTEVYRQYLISLHSILLIPIKIVFCFHSIDCPNREFVLDEFNHKRLHILSKTVIFLSLNKKCYCSHKMGGYILFHNLICFNINMTNAMSYWVEKALHIAKFHPNSLDNGKYFLESRLTRRNESSISSRVNKHAINLVNDQIIKFPVSSRPSLIKFVRQDVSLETVCSPVNYVYIIIVA